MTPLRMLSVAVIALFTIGASGSGRSAIQIHKALTAEAERLRPWAADTTLQAAVKAQNAQKIKLAEIKRIDGEWVAGKPLKSVTTGPCSDHLRKLALEHNYYVEIFITDNQGALVCSNSVTSDYWQGDEEKFTRAFADGKGAVYIDRPRFDESSKTNLGSISLPIIDGASAIGVLTVGVVSDQLPDAVPPPGTGNQQ